MKNASRKAAVAHERAIFSLPKELLAELGRYAQVVRGGNKSGFVADAIQAYITHLRKTNHTRKLRQSYAAAAGESLAVAQEWEPLSEEAWAKLNEVEN